VPVPCLKVKVVLKIVSGRLILSHVSVTIKTGFKLNDWIYCTLYIHTVQECRHYRAIAILHPFHFTIPHALGFSVLTSRILAIHLSQSHCNFKSHMKSSCHSLIPFLPFLQLLIPKTRLLSTTVVCSALLQLPLLLSESESRVTLQLAIW
jgi:hypothetical protein